MQFVEFDEKTGTISGITNTPSTNVLSIEVEKILAKKFIDGEENLTEWKVVPDLSSPNKYKLIKVVKHTDEDFNNPNIFPIKTTDVISKDKNLFHLIQDKGLWYGYANTDDDTKQFYMSNDGYFGTEKLFYLTEKNDNRVYIGQFKVEFEKLFNNEKFKIEFNCDKKCDIFTASRNSEFIHVEMI